VKSDLKLRVEKDHRINAKILLRMSRNRVTGNKKHARQRNQGRGTSIDWGVPFSRKGGESDPTTQKTIGSENQTKGKVTWKHFPAERGHKKVPKIKRSPQVWLRLRHKNRTP